MAQEPTAPSMPKEIPESFFEGLPRDVAPPSMPPRSKLAHPTAPVRALILYDTIIDDIISHPGTTIADTCRRLQKSPSTISLVMRSDFFKARWLQRREQYNEEMHARLTAKMGEVLEQSLDNTLKVLKQKAESTPLNFLDSTNKNLLDRLGYAPASVGGGGVNVLVSNNNNGGASVAVASASPEGLAAAQAELKKLEAFNAASGVSPGNALSEASASDVSAGLVVEGEASRVEP